MPVLRRPDDHHRDVRRRTPCAIATAKPDQDRHLMIITALPASQPGFSSPPAARRSRKPMSSRGRQPSSDRRARARPAHTRDQTRLPSSVPPPRFARHQPATNASRPDPKISVGRARPNGVPSYPRFPPWEAFERRPQNPYDRPANGRRPKPFTIAEVKRPILLRGGTRILADALGSHLSPSDAHRRPIMSASDAIRQFHVNFPEAELTDLRKRVNATKWPERETVADATQGVQLATIQKLADYWGTGYDWSKCEAKLKALPHFMTEIDGLDIHFIHVRSKHENALPMIVTHGWPGSIIEQLKIIEPLTNPTAHGASASDAFDLVIPSIPGYGFTEKPRETGWDTARTARAWAMLMDRLGYTQYVAQGGDLGSVVTTLMGEQAPPGLLGIHTSLPPTVPPAIAKALACGDPAPSGLSTDELHAYAQLQLLYGRQFAYAAFMRTRPQTLYG